MTAPDLSRDRTALIDDLRMLLDESPESARARERSLVERLQEPPSAPIVLYGAGNLGRRTLRLLRTHRQDAAAFIDNDPARWGTAVDGVPVLSVEDATSRFAADGLAIVTIWRAEGGHDFLLTRSDLHRRGWKRVESFIPLYWGLGDEALPYITIDAPTNVLKSRDDILEVADLWGDDRSLREYVGQVRWRLTADFAALSAPEPDQYFAHGLVRATSAEVFVDCGAFTGDTLLDVRRRLRSWQAYYAFEPDPVSYPVLAAVVDSLPPDLADRVHLRKAATSDHTGVARFSATGLAGAGLSDAGDTVVECVSLDEVIDEPPTFVKMDIEGAEPAALRGATRSVQVGNPLLAVAAYHRQADLWELAAQVHKMAPDHGLFLRPHVREGFDTILYAIPSARLALT